MRPKTGLSPGYGAFCVANFWGNLSAERERAQPRPWLGQLGRPPPRSSECHSGHSQRFRRFVASGTYSRKIDGRNRPTRSPSPPPLNSPESGHPFFDSSDHQIVARCTSRSAHDGDATRAVAKLVRKIARDRACNRVLQGSGRAQNCRIFMLHLRRREFRLS